MPSVLFAVTVSMTAQSFLRGQMSLLARDGWEVHLACSPDDGTDSFEQLGSIANVSLYPLMMVRPPNLIKDLQSLVRWVRLLRSVRPDVLVASTPKAGLLATAAARFLRVPLRIYHVRGLRAEGLNGPLRFLSLLSERLAIKSANEILVDSPSLLAEMRRLGLLRTDEGVVLGAGSCCGVDVEHFRPAQPAERSTARKALGLADGDFVVGFVGRIVADKGVRELHEAMGLAQAVYAPGRLVLAGPTENEDSVRALLDSAANDDWVTLTGPIADPRSVYWALDVYCIPSYREGFPIAPLEAQACGVPVIATTATGCVDAVEPGVTGLTVAARDPRALRDAILHIRRDTALRKRMSRAARERVLQFFDRNLVERRFGEFLETLRQPAN